MFGFLSFILLILSVILSGALALLCPSQVDPRITVNVAHPTTCAKYMSCVHTQPREMHCPGGLEWNDQESICDYPGKSGCSRNVPEEVARLNGSALVAASVCLPQEVSECPLNSSPGEVALLKHPDCRKFYTCSLGKESPMSCPEGLFWNARSCRCDYEGDAECGEGGMRPVEEEVDEVPEKVTEQQADAQPQQEEQTQELEQFEEPEAVDQNQPSILLAEPQVAYEPASRFRFRRDTEAAAGESGNSADSGSSGSDGGSPSSGNSGSSGSGGSGSSSNSGGNQPIGDGSDGGVVAAGAGIREVSAFAVMMATLVFSSM